MPRRANSICRGVWGTETNHKKMGGEDEYTLLGTFPNSVGRAVIPLKQEIKSFYKVIIEGKHNSANRWIINEEIK